MALKDAKKEKEKEAPNNKKEDKVKKAKEKKEKKKKVGIARKRDTVVFVSSDEEAQEIINQIVDETSLLPVEEKKQKSFIMTEIKSFLAILFIIGMSVLFVFLFYNFAEPIKKFKDNDGEETKVVESSKYKTISYKASDNRKLEVLNDTYVLEYDDNTLYKVLDMDGNLLFEGNEVYTDIVVGVDDELYLILMNSEVTEEDGLFEVYKFENKRLEEILNLSEEGFEYTPFFYNKNGIKKLLGVVGEKYFYDDDYQYDTKSKVYLLNDKEYELDDIRFVGDTVRLAVDEPIYTYDSRYVVVVDTYDEYKYGIYDLKTGDMVINTKYDGLYTTYDGNYIAIKDKKAGIVNLKSKILVDFKYDFISDHNGFYVVCKDKKLGIVNYEFKEVVKPIFAYQEVENYGFSYRPCCGSNISFDAYKYKDKYILTVNVDEIYNDLKYKVHESYVISEDGEYTTIVANEFAIIGDFIYGYDKESKKYIIYDSTFAEKGYIDISGYDFENNPILSVVNENTIIVELDSDLYYDLSTLEEITSIKDASYIDGKIEFKYLNDSKEVTLKVNGEKVSSYKYDPSQYYKFYNKVSDKLYYYVTDNTYVMVRKSE